MHVASSVEQTCVPLHSKSRYSLSNSTAALKLYNRGVRTRLWLRRFTSWLLSFMLLGAWAEVRPQATQPPGAESKQPGGHVVLVLPFDNRSAETNLNWIGDSFPDTLNQRLSSAGFLTITRDDRLFALDHLGLPPTLRPTRATTIRIAQTLDADYVIVGSYKIQGSRILVQAQVLEVDKLRLSTPLEDSSELARLLDIENAVAWKVARQIDPQFPVAQQTFLAASAGVRLSAFESYIRGTDATSPAERVKRLQTAVGESPRYAAAELALGKQLYADREYDQAAAVLAKVQPTSRLALEANFYLGLARFNAAKYADAANAFGFVASRLPLPEVVNDEGVAQARQGKDGTALFQRAANTDPNDPDYRYNLAVSHFRHGDLAGAQREIDQALKLRATDTEAAALKARIAQGKASDSVAKTSTSDFDPMERLRRTYSEAGFRQAAFQLDQVRAIRLSTLPASEQAAEYTTLGRDYLRQGLLPEAEREFHAALLADPHSGAGHAGLAQVREQSGDGAEARAEAQASLNVSPNAAAYLVLARVALAKNDLGAAAASVRDALHLEPTNTAAMGLRTALTARGQSLP